MTLTSKYKSEITFKTIIFKLLIILIVLSFISAERFTFNNSIFSFDFFLMVYIIVYFLWKQNFKISRFTFELLKISFIILFPSIVLVNFSNNPSDSFAIMLRYIFLITILPLFFESVYKTGQYIFVSEKYQKRFVFGEMSPNEMGHYLILLLFTLNIFVIKRIKYFLFLVSVIPFVFTFSKTVLLQIIMFFLLKKLWILILGFIIFYFIIDGEYISLISSIITNELSVENYNNAYRIQAVISAIENIPNTILFPAYRISDNIDSDYLLAMNAHNVVFYYITNFGLISFILLCFYIVYFILKNLNNKYFWCIFIFIFLDSITIFFNPILNYPLTWFPLYLYISTFQFIKINNTKREYIC